MATLTGSATKHVLDRVRELLGAPTVGPACLTCGAATPLPFRDLLLSIARSVRPAYAIRMLAGEEPRS